ncbi:hypothetical protein FRB99_000257 [Tulasnella sp. 403]|nr:hypothetical protein FRB99_000257 [Tulasnella sp. 403]
MSKSDHSDKETISSEDPIERQPPVQPPPYAPPAPSIRLLFCYLTRRDVYTFLSPAVFVSIVAGGIAPFMTRVIGQVFDAFARFPTSDEPLDQRKHRLLHDVGLATIELIALAAGTLLMNSIMASLWMWVGERNVLGLRRAIYESVTHREMEWFDLKAASEPKEDGSKSDSDAGAGGLVAKFTRDTDDVRMATSLNTGMLVQYLTTFITCLVLALVVSWSLTLVILSSIPLLVFIQGISQNLAIPLYNRERTSSSSAGTHIERAVRSITTVKAFNAQTREKRIVDVLIQAAKTAYSRCCMVWGVTAGLTQFILFAMFVQGFWFGSKLVRDGSITPGQVMAVFWACLIASSNLQLCIPLLIYLPDGETTFIVGGSGSGKSTIAQLLLRMYEPTCGTILFDDRDLRFLDPNYVKRHVAAVTQTCVLFDMTVHENVAMGLVGHEGRRPQDATREEIERVCRAALMHEFIRDLPDGYDTRLGTSGASLSGGQRQRLAIARALLRDPTVLILDEATSALDPTSRVLVFEAIKMHRRNRTTIVITHDLSQITAEEFVYVMKKGKVVEQGFRSALEKKPASKSDGEGEGEFRRMLEVQFSSGGFPMKGDEELGVPTPEPHDDDTDDAEDDEDDTEKDSSSRSKHASYLGGMMLSSLKHLSASLGRSKSVRSTRSAVTTETSSTQPPLPPNHPPKWMFDAVADLANPKSSEAIHQAVKARRSSRNSRPPTSRAWLLPGGATAPRSSFQSTRPKTLKPDDDTAEPRPSLQFEPLSPPPHARQTPMADVDSLQDDDEFEREKRAMTAVAEAAGAKRKHSQRVLRAHFRAELQGINVSSTSLDAASQRERVPTLLGSARQYYPTLPNKLLILFGLMLCVVNGALTPVFSVALSQLMALVGDGARDTKQITLWGMIVLLIALGDGIAAGSKFFIMEHSAMAWISALRSKAYAIILRQDKKWFDAPEHGAQQLVQLVIKDGDDARMLVATVLTQLTVVVAMLGVGLIWALVRGWQLTLVGFAIGPVFALAMMAQSALMARYELKSKRAREEVSKKYFESVSNVRAIRSMALEEVFSTQYEHALQDALRAGVQGAMVAGTGYGVANALVYVAEAVLFYVGAVMLSKGTYSYLQLLEVLNLVVFTVSIASQMMAFIPKIAKANQAAADLGVLLSFTQEPDEAHGDWRFPVRGDIAFENVDFAYPQRPDVPVLKRVNFKIKEGECVAIVGPSGSGKSTIAALLQRLYEPSSGDIKIGRFTLSDADVAWLRSHVAVVSQHPALFDASIKDNILYGPDSELVPFYDVQRAARDANLEEFIVGLPQQYDTMLGEDASLISGGQAQRISLARALVNGKAHILLLDEFTSALDATNQDALMETVMKIREERTTVIVTHKVPIMRKCDRVLVVNEGVLVEEGSYDALMAKKGAFWSMASAGEWAAE